MAKEVNYDTNANKTISIPFLVKMEREGDGLGEIPSVDQHYHQQGLPNPKKTFQLIEQGFIENYLPVRNIAKLWFNEPQHPSKSNTNQYKNLGDEATNSSIYHRLKRIKNYVLHGEYELTNAESGYFCIASYNKLIRTRELTSLPILECLYDDVEAIYQFWNLAEQQASRSDEERSINQRCFAIFALTAWTRFRIDFGLIGDFRETVDNSNYLIEPIFTSSELALLCGGTDRSLGNEIMNHRKKSVDHPSSLFSKNPKFKADEKYFKEARYRVFSNGDTLSQYREVDEYIAKGRVPPPAKRYVTHREALILLKHKESFQASSFSNPA